MSSIKIAKKKKRQEQAQQKKAEKIAEQIAKDSQDKVNTYKRMFDSVTASQIEANHKQRYNDMASNLSYNSNRSTMSAMEEARLNAPYHPTLKVEDFGIVEDFIYSGDELVDKAFDGDIAAGRSYEDINSGINKAFRQGDINEDQYGLAKRTLKQNESFIRNLKKSADNTATGQVVKEIGEEVAEEVAEEAVNVGNPYLKQVFSGRNLGAVLNLGFAISDYNEARNAGDGVVKSAAKAGAQFVAGEMLGAWMFPVMLAKQVPSIAVNTIEATQQMTRQMNSTSRIQTFGEAQFRDTQQLATMRQAGMEMAKMSQYNLQQSIMGNEAQYMHRL